MHLVSHLLQSSSPKYDVYFVDQLSTCVPLLRIVGKTRVVFYCHFPDKLLADGAYVEGETQKRGGLLKRLYRLPVDKLEEVTTRKRILDLPLFVKLTSASLPFRECGRDLG
jgi:alpha-1,3/alpha-1,6-mannosyltransferase